MTQQDIVNQLNRLIVGYNITWDDIKYDADRAIMNINNRLGAKFPMMSQVLVGSNVSYELDTVEGNIPIIQDQYIHTVIIPFIASEILARDEEFTTIYNKYLMDYENGLFDMFQYEFNRIPLAFRQSKDVGVFFSYDTPQRKVHDTIEKNLPLFKFKIYYHLNVDYDLPDNFTFDNNLYDYGTYITVKEPTVKQFIKDHYLYKFSHWCINPNDEYEKKYVAGNQVSNINGTVHLYAVWTTTSIINIDDTGTITLNSKDDLKELLNIEDVPEELLNINVLVIPMYIDKQLVQTIGSNFLGDYTVNKLILPKTNLSIVSGAFNKNETESFAEMIKTEIIFPSYDWIRKKPSITINSYSISVDTVYLPYSIEEISASSIRANNIKCQIFENEKPSDWVDDDDDLWYDSSIDTNIEWGVING